MPRSFTAKWVLPWGRLGLIAFYQWVEKIKQWVWYEKRKERRWGYKREKQIEERREKRKGVVRVLHRGRIMVNFYPAAISGHGQGWPLDVYHSSCLPYIIQTFLTGDSFAASFSLKKHLRIRGIFLHVLVSYFSIFDLFINCFFIYFYFISYFLKMYL